MSKNEQICKIYNFPVPSEHEELTWEEKERMREDQALAAMRAKARLELNTPSPPRYYFKIHREPWYKRLAKWYEDNCLVIFDGFGPGLIFLAAMLFFIVVFSQLAILYGW